jgi:TatD DNase family protein
LIQPPTITDSHCHLDFSDFSGELDDIIDRAQQAGVRRLVTICTRLSQEPDVRRIAETYNQVFYAAGNHPMNADKEPMATLEKLVTIAAHPKLVAIGETGLDYHYTMESAEVQKKSLCIHIKAAQTTKLPLIIHARGADQDMAEILKSEYKNAPYSCVMHCFSSSPELGKTALDLGFYLSMSGIATFPKSQEVRDIFAAAPMDQILVETDAPYLAPPPYRGKRNEPAYSTFTAQVGADVFGVSLEEFAAQTEANFERLFWKAT